VEQLSQFRVVLDAIWSMCPVIDFGFFTMTGLLIGIALVACGAAAMRFRRRRAGGLDAAFNRAKYNRESTQVR
jgi:hypothetical protein